MATHTIELKVEKSITAQRIEGGMFVVIDGEIRKIAASTITAAEMIGAALGLPELAPSQQKAKPGRKPRVKKEEKTEGGAE